MMAGREFHHEARERAWWPGTIVGLRPFRIVSSVRHEKADFSMHSIYKKMNAIAPRWHRPARLTVTLVHKRLFIALLLTSTFAISVDAQDGPKNAVVLIIRHGEKPASGVDLSPLGKERAKAYKHYFQDFTVDSRNDCARTSFLPPKTQRGAIARV